MKKSRRTYNGVHLNKKSNTQDVVEQSLTEYYEEYTMIGNTLTELYRLESVSMPNSINYYANSYYSRLKGKKPLGLVINNASCWTHSCREYALQGIGKRVVRILKRI